MLWEVRLCDVSGKIVEILLHEIWDVLFLQSKYTLNLSLSTLKTINIQLIPPADFQSIFSIVKMFSIVFIFHNQKLLTSHCVYGENHQVHQRDPLNFHENVCRKIKLQLELSLSSVEGGIWGSSFTIMLNAFHSVGLVLFLGIIKKSFAFYVMRR